MSLYIGAYYPDRQLDESMFGQALMRVAANLAKHRRHPLQMSPPYLDIQFMVSGKQESPDFEGMRMSNYDEGSATLRIESAVPERIVNSTHTEAYVLAVMQDAVDNAADYFETESVPFLRDDYLQFIEMIAKTGGEQQQMLKLN